MSQVIRMEVEAVERTLSTLRSLLRQGRGLEDELRRAARALPFAWQGPSAEHFTQDLHGAARRYEQLLSELEQLTQALEQEKEEWLAADAAFGEGQASAEENAIVSGNGGVDTGPLGMQLAQEICQNRKDRDFCESVWSQPPRHAGDVAYMIATLPEETPIGIFVLDNGEVLVLLKGTDPDDPERGNNWGSAIESFFVRNSSYQLSVLAALAQAVREGRIPPNAKLHIAGHSQGGMIAQNLASDPRLAKLGLQVASVVTFGSPDTFTKPNPGTRYIMFEHASDRVAQIDEYADILTHGLLSPTSPNLVVEGFVHMRLSDVESAATRYTLHVSDSSWMFDHNYAREAVYGELSQYSNLPFVRNGAQWSDYQLYEAKVQTPIARAYERVGSAVEAAFAKIASVFDAGGGGLGSSSGGW